MNSPAAIVLAAGYSQRMARFKPLLTLGGQTLVDRVISLFADQSITVILVTGWRGDELAAAVAHRPVTIVPNAGYAGGMLSSIQAGLRHLDPACPAFFVLPVDIPLVRPFTIRRLLDASAAAPQSIIYPSFLHRRGHPPLLPGRLVPAVLDWQGPGGLRGCLATRAEPVREVPVADRFILADLDTPAEFAAVAATWERYSIPTAAECDVLLTEVFPVSAGILAHCRQVAGIAAAFGQALLGAGQNVDVELVQVAALLHDIARDSPQHALAGAAILRRLGFDPAAEIVAQHMDLSPESPAASLEAKIVFLADKFVVGERVVTLQARYQSARDHYAATAGIASVIEERQRRALAVRQQLETLLGFSLTRLLPPAG